MAPGPNMLFRRPGEGRGPGRPVLNRRKAVWIPASAGMTKENDAALLDLRPPLPPRLPSVAIVAAIADS